MSTDITSHDPENWEGRTSPTYPQAQDYLYPQVDSAMESVSILDQLQLFPLPVPPSVTPRPITEDERARIATLSELQFFLATAPTRWNQADTIPSTNLTKFQLPNGEYVSCILWNGLYHITGTDIVRALSFRFEAFGRPVKATKKWEEGVFSDLRNLKPGLDASLEEPKSSLLDFLFRNGCIRTQKKQKVFYWFSVPHDRLFLDALERDLKREKIGQQPTTEVVGEPARSFRYDPRRSLYEQFAGQNPGLTPSLLSAPMDYQHSASSDMTRPSPSLEASHSGFYPPAIPSVTAMSDPGVGGLYGMSPVTNSAVTFQRTLFEGSPAYKKRRVRSRQGTSPSVMDENGLRREGSIARSYTSDIRGTTSPPRLSHAVLRKVSGGSEREASPSSFKRERDDSVVPDYDVQVGEKVFVCAFDFCRRPFKRLEHLKRHVRTHTQERPFVCGKCSRSFSRQDNLTQHLRTHNRLEESNGDLGAGANPGLGLGTPPPREGVDYYVTTAGPNGVASATGMGYRWATASPAGDGGPPYRAAGSMPPPSLPYSSRHSTAPPDWGNTADGSVLAAPDFSYPDPSNVRRFRSVTPSAVYQPSQLSVSHVPGALPAGWAPGELPQMAPYTYSYWRPPSDLPYTAPPTAPSVMGSVGDGSTAYEVGSQTPMSYVEQTNESYPNAE